jgi:hypothetical protein
MSYIPPHARNQLRNKNNKPIIPDKSNTMTKLSNKPTVNDFPELIKSKPIIPNKMNFKQLFDEETYEAPIKPKEIKKGLIILTHNGVIDSLTNEEREIENNRLNNKIMHNNLMDMYNHIDIQRKTRLISDPYYIPEEVVIEYSSSEASISTVESETDAEDPDDEYDM